MVDSQLGHAFAYRLDVTRIAFGQTIESRLYARAPPQVGKVVQPTSKLTGCPKLDHS